MNETMEVLTPGGRLVLYSEYIVCHAPAYPDPFNVHPPTLETARQFRDEHGGEIKHRWVSDRAVVA